MRICDICGVIDDGPRHVIGHAPGEVPVDAAMVSHVQTADLPEHVRAAALEALNDSTLQIRHLTCCAAAGCETCTTTTQER